MKQIGDGAEAIIYLDKDVIKERIRKSYRHKDIDLKLRKFRTRRESKVLKKLEEIKFPAPRLIDVDDKEMKIVMDYIDAPRLRDVINSNNQEKICKEIGNLVAILHNKDIIHGDLTTSNMLLKEKLYFIDFGLSFFSKRVEDKAVDIHLLRQALESKHYKIWRNAFKNFLLGYKKADDYKEIMLRFEKVEGRGRYKGKG
jgi:Kae1-associated kinase Bud32